MTTRPQIDDIASLLRVPITSLRLVSAVGSRTYGTSTATSDHDFVAVVHGLSRDDLVQRGDVDIIVKTPATFQKSLDDQSIFSLQALQATPENTLLRRQGAFKWVLRRERLVEATLSTMARDLSHAEKRFDDDRRAATRRAIHALRVGQFAVQICSMGRIDDFTSVRPSWLLLTSNAPSTWADIMRTLGDSLADVRGKLASYREPRAIAV